VLDKPPVYKVAAGAVCALGFGCCGISTSQLVLAFAGVLVWEQPLHINVFMRQSCRMQ
jgi:hypothetical protein